MAEYNNINNLLDDIMNNLHKAADIVLERLNDETNVAVDKAYKEYGAYQRRKVEQIFRDAVLTFYDAYDPQYYTSRQYGLYELLDPSIDTDGMIHIGDDYLTLFNADKMHPDRSGGDSLFQTVFIEGYHGGAKNISSNKSEVWGAHPSPGTPYYRRSGKVTYPNGVKKWHKYGKWGRPAVKTDSAYNIFSTNLRIAEDTEMYEMFSEIAHRHNDEAFNKVCDEIPDIMRELDL